MKEPRPHGNHRNFVHNPLVNSWSLSDTSIGTGEAKILTILRMDSLTESFYLDENAIKWLGQVLGGEGGGKAPQTIN